MKRILAATALLLSAAPPLAAQDETACYIWYRFTPSGEGSYSLHFAMVEAPVPAGRGEIGMLAGAGRSASREGDAFPLGVVRDYATAVRQVRERLDSEAPGHTPASAISMSGTCSEPSLARRGQIATGVVVRRTGPPPPRTTADSVALVRQWAEAGNPMAQAILAGLYDEGRGVPRDGAQAVRWYRSAAEGGVPEAMASLGNMLLNGRGVAADPAAAVGWYRRAAEAGYAEAEYLLGLLYEIGRGVPADEREAARWYRLAADRGRPSAAGALGQMYATGRGVDRDDAQALRWLRRGADGGDAAAMGNLAGMYIQGRGVAADAAQGLAWLRRAAEGGHGGSQFNMAILLMQGQMLAADIPAGVAMLRRAAEGGFIQAQRLLGTMHFTGEHVPRSDADAMRWWRRAAEAGDAPSQLGVGTMLAEGRGAARDDVEAAVWLELGRSAISEDAEAQAADRAVRGRLNASQRAEVQRRVAARRGAGPAVASAPAPAPAPAQRPERAPPTPASRRPAGEIPPVITRQLEAFATRVRGRGFSPAGSAPLAGALNHGTQEDQPLTLQAGREYVVVGVCDGDCSDMDLRLMDGAGRVVAEDVATDDTPVLSFTARVAGEHRLRVMMPACSANPCYYGVSVFAK